DVRGVRPRRHRAAARLRRRGGLLAALVVPAVPRARAPAGAAHQRARRSLRAARRATRSRVAAAGRRRRVQRARGPRGVLGGPAVAAARDPGLALAHAGAAVCLFLEERFPETKAATEAARAAVAGASRRESSHVAALTAWTSGKVPEAERLMREHLATWPRDAMVFQRLYYVYFWLGRFPEMLALTDSLRGHYPGSSFVLGLHAFALEEADRLPEATRTAEAALQLEPNDAWSVHALAHALYESESFDAGVSRLPAAIHPCRGLNWFRNHLLWHLALLHFARGEYARASDIARATFEREPSSIAGDLHDSISLLWRLELVGQPVGARWEPFTAIARERVNRMGLLLHAA